MAALNFNSNIVAIDEIKNIEKYANKTFVDIKSNVMMSRSGKIYGIWGSPENIYKTSIRACEIISKYFFIGMDNNIWICHWNYYRYRAIKLEINLLDVIKQSLQTLPYVSNIFYLTKDHKFMACTHDNEISCIDINVKSFKIVHRGLIYYIKNTALIECRGETGYKIKNLSENCDICGEIIFDYDNNLIYFIKNIYDPIRFDYKKRNINHDCTDNHQCQ